MRIGLILTEALGGLRRNISMVISVVLVTFVSLTFVGAAILMQAQIGTMRGYWTERAQVAVYMCSDISEQDTCVDGGASEEQVNAVRAQREDQASVITPEQAFEVFFVTMKDPGQSQVISEAFNGVAGVEQVQDQLQYLEPLFSALTVATYIAVGIATLMLIAAILLIGTTIRLSAYARRKEIGIMRLVGASNRFIQTPFVLEGVFAAFLGSALASAAVVAGVHFGVDGYLRGRVPFITTWVSMQDAVVVVPVLIGIGVVLAALSAGFAIRRWLRT